MFLCLILLAEVFFVKLEYKLLRNSREHILYVEYTGADCLDVILSRLGQDNIQVSNIEITRSSGSEHAANVIIYVRLNRKTDSRQLRSNISGISGVLSVDEL